MTAVSLARGGRGDGPPRGRRGPRGSRAAPAVTAGDRLDGEAGVERQGTEVVGVDQAQAIRTKPSSGTLAGRAFLPDLRELDGSVDRIVHRGGELDDDPARIGIADVRLERQPAVEPRKIVAVG